MDGKVAANVNIVFGNFEMALITTVTWGNFDQTNPKVEFEIDGESYSMTVSEFKSLIKRNALPI
jgi:hypothetical protein